MSEPVQYTQTDLPQGVDSIIQICEDLRVLNEDGYVPGCGGVLTYVSGCTIPVRKGTTCSPFTGTVIGVAFDTGDYPRKVDARNPYVPMVNGGKDPLPFHDFYNLNNNSHGVDAIEKYNLGHKIDPTQMRRGDLVEIGWQNTIGHSVFCWDVHLDGPGPDAKVDCFQIIGSNGNFPGVSIYGCWGDPWITGKNAVVKSKIVEKDDKKHPGKKKKETEWWIEKPGNLSKCKGKDKIFVDEDAIVEAGVWLVLPGVKKIDMKSFRKKPMRVVYPGTDAHSVASLKCARLHYKGEPPKPYCMKDGAAPTNESDVPGHLDAAVTVVKGRNVKRDAQAPGKATPKPATQEKGKPLTMQHDVEQALQQFYRAKWIKSDPGNSDDINDAKTQEALKEFQTKFHLKKVDGIAGPETRGAIARQLPASLHQVTAQLLLGNLCRGKKLTHDPGPPDGINNDETLAAVEEFQKSNGLDVTGLPDADTLAKIMDVCRGHAATTEKPGLEPGLHHLYWVGNTVAPGGSAKLRLHSRDLVIGQECPILLIDEAGGKEIEASANMKVDKAEVEMTVPIPADFSVGTLLKARVTAALSDEGELEATTSAPLQIREKSTGPIAIVKGDDVYLDPPVRLLPQYDNRWKRARIAGPKTGRLIDWINNGCNASTAAMTLRWFAEDCKAGKIPFPTKPGGSIDQSWYGLRMAESFWPNADPPGKVALTGRGTIDFLTIYKVAAHYLKTGEIQRAEKGEHKGDVVEPSGVTARYVSKEPAGGWLGLIRDMLKTGPVIVGIGAPAGHFVLAHGIVGGGLLLVDPGGVLFQAHNGGTAEIANWKDKDGYVDGTMDKDRVRMPSLGQWPGGKAPGQEADGRSYNLISGQFLSDLLSKLISVTSLTYPEGARLGTGTAPAEAKPVDDSLEVFFKFKGSVGESSAARDHTYAAYKVKGKSSAYLIKGRLQVDVDGAPNCYHPEDLNVLNQAEYLTVDLMSYRGALDKKSNGGHPGNWFGVVTDTGEKTGTPIIQGQHDPCPGFYVSSTSLVDQTKHRNDPNRYVDARRIPYIAFPGQVYAASGSRFTQVTQGPTGEIGDFLTVVNPDADDAHRYCHAVFADMGGGDDPHFGEGSPALAQRVHAAGIVEAKMLYIIYPHSGQGRYRIPTLEEIKQKGETLFNDWGGMEEVNRVLPLMDK